MSSGEPPRRTGGGHGGICTNQRPNRLCVRTVDEWGRRIAASDLGRWLARVAPGQARGTLCLALVGDACMRGLNRRFRDVDRVTDVLSFPAGPTHATLVRAVGAWASPFLGDIVIARGVARRQARAEGHTELTELRVLALHGLLHLLGYDHEGDNGRMRRLEQRLRRKGGLHEGLIERSGFSHDRSGAA